MANIMLTYRCNLKCPYCFANEFVNHSQCDISMDNFHTALEFIKSSKERHIGLIGGEPTILPHFREVLQILSDDDDIEAVTIYTNGIKIDSCLEFMQNTKFNMLVNCNSPRDIGEAQFAVLRRNLDQAFLIKDVWKRLNLGINLYSNSLDYSYIVSMLERYNLHRVRMSVTVPNMDADKAADSLEYMQSRKDYILGFIQECAHRDIAPYFDCNVIPKCIWTEEQLQILRGVIDRFHLKSTNLLGNHGFCRPVIDILPDLTAVRCFGTSDFTKVSIRDFRCFEDLRNYYVNLIDCHVTSCMKHDQCKSCYEKKVLQCTAGCLAFIKDALIKQMTDQ